MKITINQMIADSFDLTARMITELINYHRKLNNSPKEYWQTDEESRETLNEWAEAGEVYNILAEDEPAGFFYIKFGGNNAAWLEDLYVMEGFRGKGIGKIAMKKLDELMKQKGVTAMFVDVIPRNTGALKLYSECGFDHLNLIQLRKNYDKRLNKNEEVEVLGFKLKKY